MLFSLVFNTLAICFVQRRWAKVSLNLKWKNRDSILKLPNFSMVCLRKGYAIVENRETEKKEEGMKGGIIDAKSQSII